MSKRNVTCLFAQCIGLAADSLRRRDLDQAYGLIVEAMRANPDAPQPHNLFGIWSELSGNEDSARRHYRAAYSLDPTFKPACRNLERICTSFENIKSYLFDYGDESEEAVPECAKKAQ